MIKIFYSDDILFSWIVMSMGADIKVYISVSKNDKQLAYIRDSLF